MASPLINDTRLKLLQDAYQRLNEDSCVAFIDESYVIPENAHGDRTFYIATAYVAPVRLHEPVRRDLSQIVGRDYWHTSEAHLGGATETIHELCRYLAEAEEGEGFLLAIKTPIADVAGADELAREACLTSLLVTLHLGELVPHPALVVAEERRHQGQRARDLRTIKNIRRTGLIGQTQVIFTSPSVERLLWVPDIVSFAQSHYERGSSTGYVAPLQSLLRIIDVEKSNPR